MIGSDLQCLSELRSKTDLFGNRAVFTAYEREYCKGKRDPWASFGGLLCAKEACVKALAAFDDAPTITFLDLEIHHAPSGRPTLRPGSRLAAWLDALRLQLSVTISHSGDYAMATAIASGVRHV
jgi:holo-[acyl-carrier protein] synthase